MYGFWRLGLSPAPSSGATCVANGRRDDDEEEREADGDAGEHRRHPDDEVTGAVAVDPDGERRVAGQDEEPEQERALLAAPERRDLVDAPERPARVLGDVDERVVVADEPGDEDRGGDERRAERRDERVARRHREPAPPGDGGHRPDDARVQAQAEREKQRRPTEIGHLPHYWSDGLIAVYFDGHFVTIVPGVATNVPLRSSPSTTRSRPGAKRSGTLPL